MPTTTATGEHNFWMNIHMYQGGDLALQPVMICGAPHHPPHAEGPRHLGYVNVCMYRFSLSVK